MEHLLFYDLDPNALEGTETGRARISPCSKHQHVWRALSEGMQQGILIQDTWPPNGPWATGSVQGPKPLAQPETLSAEETGQSRCFGDRMGLGTIT